MSEPQGIEQPPRRGMVVIQCVGMPGWWKPGHQQPLVVGWWLESYDPAAKSGAGWEWTRDLDKARRFADHREAHAVWTTVHVTVPTRPDGRPNRPLSAFTVQIVPFGAAKADLAAGRGLLP